MDASMCASISRQRNVTFADETPSGDSRTPPDLPPRPQTLQNYWKALRPWSFSASLTPVLVGAAVGVRSSEDEWSLLILLSSCFTAVAVHAAGNLVNTYFDFERGVDSALRWCDDRTLVDKVLTPQEVERLTLGLYAVGMTSFVATVIACGGRSAFALTVIFVLGMSGSFFYTGGGRSALKYRALGELLVFAIFGPVTVAFAFFAQRAATARSEAEELSGLADLPFRFALPLALNAVALLHANNLRDVSEARLGVVTVAIFLGPFLSRLLLALLLLLPFVIFAVLALHSSLAFLLPMIAAVEALSLVRLVAAVKSGQEPEFRPVIQRIARLNLLMGGLYFAAILAAPKEMFTPS